MNILALAFVRQKCTPKFISLPHFHLSLLYYIIMESFHDDFINFQRS